ncbi:hypothetical protein L596_011036 [Steinernema carpocapsae]|uniref:Uncharacterized protein n=1 Tax=Steinernema carpocapsae TaxID=34508 RepID=A0A4U5NTI3_STECR|nr:hypothetical protein L596_011036 [Steinernema carpocapsae]
MEVSEKCGGGRLDKQKVWFGLRVHNQFLEANIRKSDLEIEKGNWSKVTTNFSRFLRIDRKSFNQNAKRFKEHGMEQKNPDALLESF